jgi:hypothetical protein
MTKYVWDDISDRDTVEMVRRMQDDERRTQTVLTHCRAKLNAGEKLDAEDVKRLREIEDTSGRVCASHTKRDPKKTTYKRVKTLLESRHAGQIPPGFYTPKLHAEIVRGLARNAAESRATNAAARACLQHA